MKFFILFVMASCVMANDTVSQWKPAKRRDLSKYDQKNEILPPNGLFPKEKLLDRNLQKSDMSSQKLYDFSTTCGRSTTSSRNVGGEEAVPHSYPWEAFIFIDDGIHCGGALITPRHVLTAAHCLGREVTIVLGAHDIENPFEEGRIEIISNRFIQHEDWHPQVGQLSDIGLILLPEDVPSIYLEGNGTINVACLPTEEPNTGDVVTITGWGDQVPDPTTSSVLHQVNVSIMSDDDCKSLLGFASSLLCTDTTEVHGTCKGDYGGPLNRYIEEKQHWEHVGIAISGQWSGCKEGKPIGFTETFYYNDWITLHTGLKV